MSRITVSVQLWEYPDPRDPTVALEISESLVREVYRPIDVPSLGAPAFARAVCTSSEIIRQVRMSRASLAEVLSKEIAAVLIKTMEANDTEMGYKK